MEASSKVVLDVTGMNGKELFSAPIVVACASEQSLNFELESGGEKLEPNELTFIKTEKGVITEIVDPPEPTPGPTSDQEMNQPRMISRESD